MSTSSMEQSERVGSISAFGEPMIAVSDVKPGTVVRFGLDHDSSVIVLANFQSHYTTGNGRVEARTLLYYGCMCEPGEWEDGRLFSQDHNLNELITVVFEPNSHC